MSKPDYVCECCEDFDGDTGGSNGVITCIPCEAWAGTCECSCDCGQCVYTDTPCGKPPMDQPCQFCVLRQDWQDQSEADDPCVAERLSEVEPVISEVLLKISQIKDDLATPHVPGMYSHDYLRGRLVRRLEPCLAALKMIKDKSKWASSVIAEVNNLLRREGFTEERKYCGVDDCTCHLRPLNSLIADKLGRSSAIAQIDGQIVMTEELRHAANDAVLAAAEAWKYANERLESADFRIQQIRRETGMILMSELKMDMDAAQNRYHEAVIAQDAAREAFTAATRATREPARTFYHLIALKATM